MAKFFRQKTETELEKRLKDCSRDTLKKLVWLCGVRSLPFLEAEGTFNYWPKEERQRCLLSMFMAIDTVAFNIYESTSNITDYAANDGYNAFAALQGDNCDTIIFNAITNIAESVVYIGGASNDRACDVIARTAYGFHVNMEAILLQDLDSIEKGKQIFHNDNSIYGESWDNFQTALRDLDCTYWADWYVTLFAKGLVLDTKDKNEIKLRMTAPYNIVAQGAASLACYIKTKTDSKLICEPENLPHKRFKIALSFPGEHRKLVETIADKLADTYGTEKVLYDKYHRAEFARPNLDTHLQKLYREDSDIIVVFICGVYDNKKWCGVEWRAIKDLLNQRDTDERIVFVKCEDGLVNGVFGTVDGYIDSKEVSANDIANDIMMRHSMLAI